MACVSFVEAKGRSWNILTALSICRLLNDNKSSSDPELPQVSRESTFYRAGMSFPELLLEVWILEPRGLGGATVQLYGPFVADQNVLLDLLISFPHPGITRVGARDCGGDGFGICVHRSVIDGSAKRGTRSEVKGAPKQSAIGRKRCMRIPAAMEIR
jgi:hypothetical protein